MSQLRHEFSYEEAVDTIYQSLQDHELRIALSEYCPMLELRLRHMIEDIKVVIETDVKSDTPLEDQDIGNLNNLNLGVIFMMLQDKYKGLPPFVSAYMLLATNWSDIYGSDTFRESCNTVMKLTAMEINFSKLLLMSEVLLKRYDNISRNSPSTLLISREYLQTIDRKINKEVYDNEAND